MRKKNCLGYLRKPADIPNNFKNVKFEQSHLIGRVTWFTQFLTVKWMYFVEMNKVTPFWGYFVHHFNAV